MTSTKQKAARKPLSRVLVQSTFRGYGEWSLKILRSWSIGYERRLSAGRDYVVYVLQLGPLRFYTERKHDDHIKKLRESTAEAIERTKQAETTPLAADLHHVAPPSQGSAGMQEQIAAKYFPDSVESAGWGDSYAEQARKRCVAAINEAMATSPAPSPLMGAAEWLKLPGNNIGIPPHNENCGGQVTDIRCERCRMEVACAAYHAYASGKGSKMSGDVKFTHKSYGLCGVHGYGSCACLNKGEEQEGSKRIPHKQFTQMDTPVKRELIENDTYVEFLPLKPEPSNE